MKAAVIKEFGEPNVFEIKDVPKPKPGVNDVLVCVHATSVNPVDTKIRAAGSWAVKPPAVIGYDVSGVIEAVGEASMISHQEIKYITHPKSGLAAVMPNTSLPAI